MRIIGYILAGCIAIAVLRLVLMVMVLAYLAALIFGLVTRPKETLGLLAVFALMAIVG